MKVSVFLTTLFLGASLASAVTPPAGFKALFNGKDLSGWRGGDTSDHRALLELSESDRAAKIAEWTKSLTEISKDTKQPHWRVENEELVNDGFGKYATTEKDYGDFELLLEYKTVAKADSGIYLRGVPQVQIWDSTLRDEKSLKNGNDKGSGGLWNNSPGAPGKDPLLVADKPFGEWNKFRIVMVGSRVSIWLNDKLVVDHAILENFYDKKLAPELRRPVPAKGPIQLQTHGGEIRWKNVFLREIDSKEANKILSSKGGEGFKSAFDGKTLDGWKGATSNYEVVDGAIRCKADKGGTIYWDQDLADFTARLNFHTPPGGNNGLAIRFPGGEGNPAYVGMTELQVLDNDSPKYAKLDPRQYHGSAYGLVAAARGYTRPAGEWNFQEVTVKGSTIKVELNGSIILDADLSKVDMSKVMANTPHPGKDRTNGFFGFAGHKDPVSFKNILIKKD